MAPLPAVTNNRGLRSRPAWLARLDARGVLVYLLLILLVIASSAASEDFRQTSNLLNVLLQSMTLALVSIGQMLVILTGGIDLSVGSVAKLSGMVGASVMDGSDAMILPAVLACLAIGAVVGLVNGTLVTRLGVAPFIATFAAFYVVRGIALAFSSEPVGRAAPSFYSLYTTSIGGLPVLVIALGVVWAFFWYLLRDTPFGRHVYAVGGDEKVARLSGVRTKRVKLAVYVLCGVLAAMAGLFNLTRIGIGDPRVGEGLELDSITAVVIGGTSLFGGRGLVAGTLGGVLLLGTINNMLDLLQVDSRYQQLIKGLIILLAVALYRERRKR